MVCEECWLSKPQLNKVLILVLMEYGLRAFQLRISRFPTLKS